MDLRPEVQAFLDALRELESLLIGRSAFWADKVRRAGDDIANSDANGLRQFLSFFGGMGSLNDFVLHSDGIPLSAENDRLDALRSRAWELGNALRLEIRQCE